MSELSGSTEWLANLEAATGLHFKYAWKPDDPLLDEFYPAYDACFAIDSEKELEQGFKDCLAMNSGPSYEELSGKYGPFREYILVAYDDAETIIGGVNFICFEMRGLPGQTGPVVSINLNYIFVLPAYRGKGYLRPLLKACSQLATRTLIESTALRTSDIRPIMFFEQNDPVRMSVEDYEADTRQSGLDQVQRIAIWAKLGARIIDFPYVQPALSDAQEADHNLLFCVMGEGLGTSLNACLLKAHLERFFQISVLKNKTDVADSRDAQVQLASLESACREGAMLSLAKGGSWASHSGGLGRKVIGTADSLRNVLFSGGKLHMTVSVRPSQEILGESLRISAYRDINKAVDPYFQDIADRSRHFIYAENSEGIVDPREDQKEAAKFVISQNLEWVTEGKTITVDLGESVEFNATVRPFWYRHVDGSLTYNLSFEIEYRHCMAHYYALSSIQKALFPTEGTKAFQDGESILTVTQNDQSFTLKNFIQDSLKKEVGQDIALNFSETAKVADRNMIRVAYLFKDKKFFDWLNRCNCERDPGNIFLDQVERVGYESSLLQMVDYLSPKKGALYFISGFVRNVIDFFRQDSAEVTDGTDFHYPTLTSNTPEEITRELEGNSYLLYANDHSVYEFVAESRSLDSANDFIGMCPYLFFVHMMALHNEALLKRYEYKIKELLDYLEENKEKIKAGQAIKEAVKKFDDTRLEILLTIEQFKHMNMLRYDTEQEFYAVIGQIRGFEERQKYWDRQLGELEKKIGDIRDRLQQDADNRLNRLVFAIGFLSLFGVIFQVTDAVKEITWPPRHDKGWPVLESAATSINIPFIVLALLVSLIMIGGASYGLYVKDGVKRIDKGMRAGQLRKIAAFVLMLTVLAAIGLFLKPYLS